MNRIASDAWTPLPNQAITAGTPIYVIDPDNCTEASAPGSTAMQARLPVLAQHVSSLVSDFVETKGTAGQYQKFLA